jgi:hypothetical protein
VVLALVIAACGGDGSDSTSDSPSGDGGPAAAESGGSGDSGSGEVVNPPSSGRATASVDGLDLNFTEVGGVACNIGSGEFSFSFRIGDYEVTLGGGGFESSSGWGGSITLVVANPDGEPGPIGYLANLPDHGGSSLAFDGTSMSYAGPMQKQPTNDGINPPAVDVGDGVISVTCPSTARPTRCAGRLSLDL